MQKHTHRCLFSKWVNLYISMTYSKQEPDMAFRKIFISSEISGG